MSARMLIEVNLTQVGADLPVPQVNESERHTAYIAGCRLHGMRLQRQTALLLLAATCTN